ncbi:MAG: 5-methylthioadenosine/S-adenosylhomocysteine deaminase [Alphaproteobacteria bacterium]|jgi:cytosine/adenosine deaminase-related metal-dependent hydrolase|nr:5-methylthioadenosine/S-adenosylhomocysteine deaminase [Alphaproteobacteria bacterium]
MTDRNDITRRTLLGGASAAGAAGALGSIATGQAQIGTPPGTTGQGGSGAEFLIRDAYVISMDAAIGDLPRGDIHVRDGTIAAVGQNLSAPGAQLIDARTMIACPGFIETHWHMWGAVARNMAGEEEKTGYFPFSRVLGALFKPEDNARGVRLALAEAISSGITTVHNWSHNLLSPAYADAELAVHREVGARARFAYGYSRNTGPNETLPLDDVARVHGQYFGGAAGLLTLGIASRGPENNTIEICKKEWEAARRLGIGITAHSGTNPGRRDSVRRMADAGLLGPDVVVVHATNTNPSDFDLLAKSGTPVSLSPFTELRTGFGLPPTGEMLKAGVPISFSVDTTLLCGNADMFAIMKAIQNVENGIKQSEFALPPRKVLETATMGGARALGIADRVGSLTPGKRADLLLVRTTDINMLPLTEPVRMLVQSAQPANIALVMVDGRILKRGAELTTTDVEKLLADATETITRVRAQVKM